jgi:hypothetical protein
MTDYDLIDRTKLSDCVGDGADYLGEDLETTTISGLDTVAVYLSGCTAFADAWDADEEDCDADVDDCDTFTDFE